MLSKGHAVLATKLQEASAALSHQDIRTRLADALRDAYQGKGGWAYLVDVFGDSESGDVVYSVDGDLMKCAYTIGTANGKATTMLDCDNAVDVVPITSYEEEAEDEDHYASMESARLYSEAPLYERFISKQDRKNAPEGSFAGKGKSFPILKPEDVMAAVRSIGRAGSDNFSAEKIKQNIIRIAKSKGWAKSLPQAWRGDDTKEEAADLELTGDFVALKEGAVGQDGTAYLKLIAPGWGSSGYYPKEVLQRDGPKVFKKGTKNFWNHQTATEEAERPEGDLRDLASVLTEDAKYKEDGPAGPGLYAKAKVFEQFRQPVDDLAKHIGTSIRATGKAKEGIAPDGKKGMIIEQLNKGISVDYVTTPGAGGQILQLFEAARAASKPSTKDEKEGNSAMTEAELTTLQESLKAQSAEIAAHKAELRKMRERQSLSEAAGEISKIHAGMTIPKGLAERVQKRLLEGQIPLKENGELDNEKLKALVEAETKDEAAYIAKMTGSPVAGMGAPALTEAQVAEQRKVQEAEAKGFVEGLGFAGMGADIMLQGRSAFRPEYNSARDGRGVKVED